MNFLTPHRRRWLIVLIIFLAMVLNYIDRQVVSVLKPTLKDEFGMDDFGYALLVNVFTIMYAVMYPVHGWLVDRFGAKNGTRNLMLGGIITWSAACMGAAWTKTIGQLAVFRGILGMAEPMAYPCQLRVVTEWFPGKLRATANSLCVAGGTVGAIIAAPMVAWLALTYNWHTAFLVPGIMGLVIALLWYCVYRNPPPEVLAETIGSTSAVQEPAFTWPQLWKTRSLWGILLCRFISDPVWYFCLFWLHGYLQENSGLTLAQVGMFGWIPFLFADLGGIGSGMFSDFLVRRGMTPLRARKVMLTVMAFVAPACVLTPHFTHPVMVLVIFSFVGAACLSWLFSLSVVIAETFPTRNVGGVLGIAAGFGAGGAVIFNMFVGTAMSTLGPVVVFSVMGILHPLAAFVLWTMVRPEHPSRTGDGEP